MLLARLMLVLLSVAPSTGSTIWSTKYSSDESFSGKSVPREKARPVILNAWTKAFCLKLRGFGTQRHVFTKKCIDIVELSEGPLTFDQRYTLMKGLGGDEKDRTGLSDLIVPGSSRIIRLHFFIIDTTIAPQF